MTQRNDISAGWISVVDIFYDQLCIGVANDTGQVKVKINGASAANSTWTSTAVIPEFERGVLTLVVGPEANPAFEVFWRGDGDAVATSMGTGNGNTGGQPYTNLYPSANSRSFAQYINLGGNDPDPWPSFNGWIGDTHVYPEQLTGAALLAVQDAVRAAMSLDTPIVTHTITASGNTGGTIDPVGAITVLDGNDQTFDITTDYGYVLDQVLVDGVNDPQAVIDSAKTFTNVIADHTVEAVWTALETISGTVTDSATTDPIYSATVTLSTNPDGSSPSQTVSGNAAGEYVIAVDDPNLTYYLIARKGGHVTSAVKTVAMTGSSVPDQDFVLVQSAGLDPLVDLDATALSNGALTSWPNTGSLGGSFDSYDGTSTPTVTTVGGKEAVQFDGVDRTTLAGTVLSPPAIAGNSDWTISTVLYRENMGGNEQVYMCWSGRNNWDGVWPASQGATAQFCYRDNTSVVHWGRDRGYDTVPSAGAWHNVTITYDGDEEILYVDGEVDWTQTWELNFRPDSLMLVGAAYSNTNGHDNDGHARYDGAIASLRIYDQALTAEEVASISGGSDPDDTDGDGLLDTWELSFPGIVDLTYLNGNANGPGPGIGTGDYDGDGTSDSAEQRLGLDPSNSASDFVATIVRDSGTGEVTLTWPSQLGLEFDVLRTDNLSDPFNTWFNLGTVTDTDGGPTESFTDTDAPVEDLRFYVIELK